MDAPLAHGLALGDMLAGEPPVALQDDAHRQENEGGGKQEYDNQQFHIASYCLVRGSTQ